MESEPFSFIDALPSADCSICVVVPARDEADSIEGTLQALATQLDLTGRPLSRSAYEIIVVANNCRDDTVARASRVRQRHPDLALHVIELELPPARAHVGEARKLGMEEACRRLLAVARPRGIIATTDADTVVSPTWLAHTRREVTQGAEAIGGRILVSADERQSMAPPVRQRFLRNVGYGALANEASARIDPRPGDPWPCHEQFSGASLAVTAQAYRRVGGLPVLPSGEDTALANGLHRADIEIRHSLDVRVYTSGRVDGRTPAGLAASLALWSARSTNGQFQLVPSAATVLARAQGRRFLRDLWTNARTHGAMCPDEVVRLAEFAHVSEAWLRLALLTSDQFGPLYAAFEAQAHWHRLPDLVDVREAISELRAWLAPYRLPTAQPPLFARHIAGLPFARPAQPSRPVTQLPAPMLQTPKFAALKEIEAVSALAPPPQVA